MGHLELELELKNPEVIEEYEQFKKLRKKCEAENRSWAIFFNRFLECFPSSHKRRYLESSNLNSLIDKKPKHNKNNYSSRYSSLRKTQTLREFYQTIDNLLRKEEIYDDVKQRMRVLNFSSDKNQEEIYELTLPVYFKLRDLGYYKYPDLIG